MLMMGIIGGRPLRKEILRVLNNHLFGLQRSTRGKIRQAEMKTDVSTSTSTRQRMRVATLGCRP